MPNSITGTRPLASRTKLLPGSRAVQIISTIITGAGVAVYFLYPDQSRSAPTTQDAPLSPTHFTPATLTSSEICSHNSKLMKLKIPAHLIPPLDSSQSPFKPIWSIFVKDDDIQVERPYTPLEGIDEEGNMSLWVKAYPKGEVGRWLHSKQAGDKLELRGPLQTWLWEENKWDEVVMISGGTGITPFYQFFHTVIRQGSPSTRFTLLHSSRNLSDLPPPAIMCPLFEYASKNPERFRLGVFVDSGEGSTPPANQQPLYLGRINKDSIQRYTDTDSSLTWWKRIWRWQSKPLVSSQRSILFLVCGPEPMVASIAGPYGRNFSQGPVGGILGELGYTSTHVWKL